MAFRPFKTLNDLSFHFDLLTLNIVIKLIDSIYKKKTEKFGMTQSPEIYNETFGFFSFPKIDFFYINKAERSFNSMACDEM